MCRFFLGEQILYIENPTKVFKNPAFFLNNILKVMIYLRPYVIITYRGHLVSQSESGTEVILSLIEIKYVT